jgi:hypothetical protein
MNKVQALLVGAAFLGLVGCSEPKTSTPEASTPANQASTAAANPAAGFKALKAVTAKTITDVKAQKYDQAKTEFEKFETSWKGVEDGVKKKSSETYSAIEDSLDTVKGELKNKQPDQAKVIAALQSLSKNVETAAKP